MDRRKYHIIAGVLLSVFLLAGCDYVNFAIFKSSGRRDGKISSSSYLWSGISDRTILINEDDPKDMTFNINMKKGSLTLVLESSDGDELYSLTKEGEYTGEEKYTAPGAGTYKLIEKGNKFCGSYKITWRNSEEKETSAGE